MWMRDIECIDLENHMPLVLGEETTEKGIVRERSELSLLHLSLALLLYRRW